MKRGRSPTGLDTLRPVVAWLARRPSVRLAAVAVGWTAAATESRPTFRRRRSTTAAGLSALVHLLLFVGLLSVANRPSGASEANLGGGRPDANEGEAITAVQVSLVPRTASNPAPSPVAETSLAAQTPDDPIKSQRIVEQPDGYQVEHNPPSPPKPAAAASPPQEGAPAPTRAIAEASTPAANGIPTRPVGPQGGDPDGGQNLLRQIARCLPPSRRPTLTSAKLTIEIDAQGALRAAPSMDVSVLTSREEMRDADLVVQAALQCGPYKDGVAPGQSVELVPDFSFLEPKPTGR